MPNKSTPMDAMQTNRLILVWSLMSLVPIVNAAESDARSSAPVYVADLLDDLKNKALDQLKKKPRATSAPSQSSPAPNPAKAQADAPPTAPKDQPPAKPQPEGATNPTGDPAVGQNQTGSPATVQKDVQSGPAPGAKLRPAAPTPAPSPAAALELTVDGLWSTRGESIRIEGNTGISANESPGSMFGAKGTQVLKFKRTGDSAFTGQIRMGSGDWVSVAGEITKDGALLLTTNSNEQKMVRPPPPAKPFGNYDVTETAPSGATYYLEKCTDRYIDTRVIGYLPESMDVRDWPSESIAMNRKAVSESAMLLQEAIAFLKKSCPEAHTRIQFLGLTHDKPVNAGGRNELPPSSLLITYTEDYPSQVWRVRNVVKEDAVAKVAEASKAKETSQQRAAQSAAAAKRAAFLRQHGAVEIDDDEQLTKLYSNPFAFEGKTIALSTAFQGMRDASTADFQQLSGMQFVGPSHIVVSNVPKNTFSTPVRALLVGKVMGNVEVDGTRALRIGFVATKICDDGKCF